MYGIAGLSDRDVSLIRIQEYVYSLCVDIFDRISCFAEVNEIIVNFLKDINFRWHSLSRAQTFAFWKNSARQIF